MTHTNEIELMPGCTLSIQKEQKLLEVTLTLSLPKLDQDLFERCQKLNYTLKHFLKTIIAFEFYKPLYEKTEFLEKTYRKLKVAYPDYRVILNLEYNFFLKNKEDLADLHKIFDIFNGDEVANNRKPLFRWETFDNYSKLFKSSFLTEDVQTGLSDLFVSRIGFDKVNASSRIIIPLDNGFGLKQ
jgi:hypothetical protein